MKKLFLLIITIVFFTSCEKEKITNESDEIFAIALKGKGIMVTICHYDSLTDTWKTISINGNALNAHLAHGDCEGECPSPLPNQTFTDRSAFMADLKVVTTIDFEEIAFGVGQANAVNLEGDEFSGVTLTPGAGSDGLFVGIPDPSISGGNNENFFASDFFPTSGLAVFSPDNYPSADSPSPDGILIVDFDSYMDGVGVYFLDAEEFPSFIEAFDGPNGTGNSLGKVIVQNKGDKSQAFAGIHSSGIKSAVLGLGGGRDGVGIDDLSFGKSSGCGEFEKEKILRGKVKKG